VEDRTQTACCVQGKLVYPKLTVVCKNGRLEGLTAEADAFYAQQFRSRVCPMCLGQGVRACSACGGTGVLKESGPCRACGGTGQVLEPCSACGGKGRFLEEVPCTLCKGAGKVRTVLP
jgi:DnaJ-class molecular chaperone